MIVKNSLIFVLGCLVLVGTISAFNFGETFGDAVSTFNVNSSEYWDTDQGTLNNTPDIFHNLISNLLWSQAGHTMDTDLDMNNYSIYNIKDLNVSNSTIYLGDAVLKGDGSSLLVEDGNVTGDYVFGDGSGLTNLNLTDISIDAGQVNASEFYGGDFFGEFFGNLSDFAILTGINGEIIDNILDGLIRIYADVFISENLDVGGNFTGNQYYGEMWNYTSAGWTYEIPTAGIYENLTNLIYGDLNGFDFIDNPRATGGSFLTANIGGKYRASFSIAFGNFPNQLFGGGIAINGIVQRDCYDRAFLSNAQEVENLEKSCIIGLNQGDTIHIQVEDETAPSSDADIYQVNLNLFRIGD